MTTHALQPHVNTTQEPPIYFLGLPTILRATGRTTNGAFGLVEQSMPPGFASPYTHHLEDEAFYVLEGEMAFVCDGQWTIAGPGTPCSGLARFLTASRSLAMQRLACCSFAHLAVSPSSWSR